MEGEAQVAFEDLGELFLEVAVGVQARDLVLVLVREQFGVVARNRFGELCTADLRGLRLAHLLDERAVARGIRRVLVVGQMLHAPLDQLVQVARDVLAERDHLGGFRDALHGVRVVRGIAAPGERSLVGLDRDFV